MELVKDHDEEFMEDIKAEPLTADKYKKKKDSLLAVIAELKDGIKDLEALNITIKLLANFRLNYNLTKSDLKKYEIELAALENQARQMSVFDNQIE